MKGALGNFDGITDRRNILEFIVNALSLLTAPWSGCPDCSGSAQVSSVSTVSADTWPHCPQDYQTWTEILINFIINNNKND